MKNKWTFPCLMVLSSIGLPAFMILTWGWEVGFLGSVGLGAVKLVIVVQRMTNPKSYLSSVLIFVALVVLILVSYIAGVLRP